MQVAQNVPTTVIDVKQFKRKPNWKKKKFCVFD